MDDKNFERLLLSVKEANEIINKKESLAEALYLKSLIQKKLGTRKKKPRWTCKGSFKYCKQLPRSFKNL
ncbi:MAG: hypothetical protein M0P02_04715 [Sulfurospirillaceae bacterium]|jgi:hypothetical protein|nr:hypothetical protein [Sulfurospirillaceae bacterium]NLM99288.1 hypothetical protein [Campylobacteraceae bacterium]